jgi:hypothetical protein
MSLMLNDPVLFQSCVVILTRLRIHLPLPPETSKYEANFHFRSNLLRDLILTLGEHRWNKLLDNRLGF